MNARPAFVGKGAYPAGVAQVFILEGHDAEIAHSPVKAGIHIARPDSHFRVQSVSGRLIPAFLAKEVKRFLTIDLE